MQTRSHVRSHSLNCICTSRNRASDRHHAAQLNRLLAIATLGSHNLAKRASSILIPSSKEDDNGSATMSTSERQEFYTPESYLAFLETTQTKYEFVDGYLRAMSSPTNRHNIVATNATAIFWLKLKGSSSRAQPVTLSIPARWFEFAKKLRHGCTFQTCRSCARRTDSQIGVQKSIR